MSLKDLRHACLSDLEKFRRKDDYFEKCTNAEKKLIRYNLGLENVSPLGSESIELDFINNLN